MKAKRGAIIDDVMCGGLRLVLCGMAAGPKSACEKTPYVGPNNKFWPTLRAVGLAPQDMQPADFRALVHHGIGLTDIAKTQWGVDTKIAVTGSDVAHLRAKLRRHRPHTVAFVGKNAAAHFLGRRTAALALGLQPEPWEGIAVFVLPSPSALAHTHWRLDVWQALAAHLGGANRSAAASPPPPAVDRTPPQSRSRDAVGRRRSRP